MCAVQPGFFEPQSSIKARTTMGLGEVDDQVLRMLLEAPEDDEPETPEEAAAVQEAREVHARGELVRDENLDRELGW
jgi:hypothetical protein